MVRRIRNIIKGGYGFGTAPVFLTSICAILGAVMFLRFGFTVGNVGFIGAIAIVLLGHMVTFPTGVAISEIATNLRVGGGGEYYIISRSFGPRIGATIGVMLYAAQSISVAFYIIGFAEGFEALKEPIQRYLLDPLPISITYDPRLISIPLALILFSIILTKGAKIGIKLLWVVFTLMVASIIIFMISPPLPGAPSGITATSQNSLGFLPVFAIAFPAFTGMTAGVGLSGDLKDPGKSIPKGIIFAIVIGFFVYLAMMVKLYLSAPVDVLASNTLIMFDMANGIGNLHLGYVILAGLFGATISSAVGFALIGPRTLQALGKDKVFYSKRIGDFIRYGKGKENEPINGTLLSAIIAIVFIFMGNLNMVAQIITMFFLIAYGSVCLISFLEHFAGNPSYRPTFKTKWYISLVGAVFSFGIMFQLSAGYAFLTLLIMGGIYYLLGMRHKRSRSFAIIFQGVMFQLSRLMKITLQRTMSKPDKFNWRPSIIAISTNAIERKGPKDMLRWISHHYGFGTLVHMTRGKLDPETVKSSKKDERILIEEMRSSKANYSVTTLVSPSTLTAVAQTVQISGISGMDNNTIMFEFHKNRQDDLTDIITGLRMASIVNYNKLVLRSTEHNFGHRQNIHLWITKEDFRNVNLMILLSYIIMEHDEWKGTKISIFTLFPKGDRAALAKRVKALVSEGRLPISMRSVKSKVYESDEEMRDKINRISKKADLTIVGFTQEQIENMGPEIFTRFDKVRDTLFVSSSQDLVIT
ncbi:MAG: amino acid permease [Candidatus Thermoplasmatota archaeon]|nr:amino acid permease [Candidatus Thermoplasmatota archaeon]